MKGREKRMSGRIDARYKERVGYVLGNTVLWLGLV